MFSDVPDNLVKAWLKYEVALVSSFDVVTSDTFLELSKLDDTTKAARIKAFLQLRVVSQQAKYDAEDSASDTRKTVLQDDIDQCNTLISGL